MRRQRYASEPVSSADREYVSVCDGWRCTYRGRRVTRQMRHIDIPSAALMPERIISTISAALWTLQPIQDRSIRVRQSPERTTPVTDDVLVTEVQIGSEPGFSQASECAPLARSSIEPILHLRGARAQFIGEPLFGLWLLEKRQNCIDYQRVRIIGGLCLH